MNRRIRKKWRQHKPLTMSYSERRKQMRIFQILAINLKHASNHINPNFLLMNQHNPFKSCYAKWGVDVYDRPVLIDTDVRYDFTNGMSILTEGIWTDNGLPKPDISYDENGNPLKDCDSFKALKEELK